MGFDLTPYKEQLGDLDLFFVDSDGRKHPIVVEHATGEPRYAIVDGKLVDYATYHHSVMSRRPVQTGEPGGSTMQVQDVKASFDAEVINPDGA